MGGTCEGKLAPASTEHGGELVRQVGRLDGAGGGLHIILDAGEGCSHIAVRLDHGV